MDQQKIKVKSIDLLVPLDYTHCCASIYGLSTK